jgi:hypothetical protein
MTTKLKKLTAKSNVPAVRSHAGDFAQHQEKLRERVLRQYGEHALDVAETIAAEQAQLASEGLLHYHRAGTRMLELQEALGDRGDACVKDIAALAQIPESTAFSMLQFARNYDLDAAQELAQLKDARNQHLTWAHVRQIVGQSEAKQQKYLEQVITESMSAAELQARIQSEHGGKRSAGGRKPTKPNSLPKAVRAWGVMCSKMLNYRKHVWNPNQIRPLIKAADPVQLRDGLRKQLLTLQAEMSQLAQETAAANAEIGDLLAYADSVANGEPTDTEAAASHPRPADKVSKAPAQPRTAAVASADDEELQPRPGESSARAAARIAFRKSQLQRKLRGKAKKVNLVPQA